MIDLHSHILYGLDDGVQDQATMLTMFRLAQEEGIKVMVATPHYIYGANTYNKEGLQKRYQEAKGLLAEQRIDIQLYLGQELYLDTFLLTQLQLGQALTLAETRYILVEFPTLAIPPYTLGLIDGFFEAGYRPVIAHPERYTGVQRDMMQLLPYIEKGCLLQVNTGSFLGLHGKEAQRTALTLLRHEMVHLVATDCHSMGRRRPEYKEAYARVAAHSSAQMAEKLFVEMPQQLLANEIVEPWSPILAPSKKSFLLRLKTAFSAGYA